MKTRKIGVPLPDGAKVYACGSPFTPPLEVDTENYGAIVIPARNHDEPLEITGAALQPVDVEKALEEGRERAEEIEFE